MVTGKNNDQRAFQRGSDVADKALWTPWWSMRSLRCAYRKSSIGDACCGTADTLRYT